MNCLRIAQGGIFSIVMALGGFTASAQESAGVRRLNYTNAKVINWDCGRQWIYLNPENSFDQRDFPFGDMTISKEICEAMQGEASARRVGLNCSNAIVDFEVELNATDRSKTVVGYTIRGVRPGSCICW